MNPFDFIKKRIISTCVFFTFAEIFMTVCFYLTDKSDGQVMPISYMLLVLALSFIMSFVNLILDIKTLNTGVKIILHAVVTMTLFDLTFGLITKQLADPKSLIIVTVFMLVLYAVIITVALAVKSFFNKRTNDKKVYLDQFRK